MRAGQRELRLGVVEDCAAPIGCVVTDLTVCREIRRDVIRIRGVLEIRLVTAVAVCRDSSKVPVGVTRCARDSRMCAR